MGDLTRKELIPAWGTQEMTEETLTLSLPHFLFSQNARYTKDSRSSVSKTAAPRVQ